MNGARESQKGRAGIGRISLWLSEGVGPSGALIVGMCLGVRKTLQVWLLTSCANVWFAEGAELRDCHVSIICLRPLPINNPIGFSVFWAIFDQVSAWIIKIKPTAGVALLCQTVCFCLPNVITQFFAVFFCAFNAVFSLQQIATSVAFFIVGLFRCLALATLLFYYLFPSLLSG